MGRFTKPVPFCVAPRRQVRAGGQGFEPCEAVLEAACSPRSILLSRAESRPRQFEGNRTPATAFTGPRARRYTTNCVGRGPAAAVIPGGLEPPFSSVSGRRLRLWATG